MSAPEGLAQAQQAGQVGDVLVEVGHGGHHLGGDPQFGSFLGLALRHDLEVQEVLGDLTQHPLDLIRELDLPDRVWRQVSSKLLARYRTRAGTESIRDLRRHAAPVRYTLLSAFCWQRRREITDGLVDLLIQIVHRISVRAEKRVIAEMVGELQRVEGKTGLLFRIADAALGNPDGIVREVLFPLVGESTLAALVKESQADGPTLRHRIQTLTHRSYGHHS